MVGDERVVGRGEQVWPGVCVYPNETLLAIKGEGVMVLGGKGVLCGALNLRERVVQCKC